MSERDQKLEARMRKLEYYHDLCIPEDTHFIIRLDGKAFHTFTQTMQKPFDEKFNTSMREIAKDLAEEYHALFVETHSDEISILFSRNWYYHNRKVEKLISLTAAMASGLCTLYYQQLATFDSRVILFSSTEDITDYFIWRRSDAIRNAINGICFHELRKEGLNPRQATHYLENRNFAWLNNFLLSKGIDFNSVDERNRRGTGIIKYLYEKMGFNPITKENVIAIRNGYKEIAVPNGDSYRNFIQDLLMEQKNESVDTCGVIG